MVEKHPGYPQELMLWTDTQQDWYWYAGSEDSPDTIHPVQPRCLGITKVLINTCMLDMLQHKVYFCHAWFQSMQWFLCKIFQKGPILNSIPRVKTILNSIPGPGWLNELGSWII